MVVCLHGHVRIACVYFRSTALDGVRLGCCGAGFVVATGLEHSCKCMRPVVQGMNFIAGCLLLFMDEEDTFWCLAIIVEELLPGYYSMAMVEPQVPSPTPAFLNSSSNDSNVTAKKLLPFQLTMSLICVQGESCLTAVMHAEHP